MYPGEFEETFRKISQIFTLGSVAKVKNVEGKLLKRNPETPIWDTIESIKGIDGIDIGDGRIVSCDHFFKKPVRILFFILIHELESRLYRIHRWNDVPLEELNSLNINDYIKDLLSNDGLVGLQDTYESRSQLKEDLKAISSFRNMIVHANRNLLWVVDADTLIKRKKQVLSLLATIQQILDRMERKSFK